jgi:outer membrane protein TolC
MSLASPTTPSHEAIEIRIKAAWKSAVYLIEVVAAMLVVGGAVGPRYKQPVISPQPYRNVPVIESRTATLPAPSLDRWWTGFSDPTLAKIVERALAQNLDLAASFAPVQQARAAAQEAGAERRIAVSNARIGRAIAEYYPKISLSGLLGGEAETPGSLFRESGFQPTLVAGLRWRLFDLGRVDEEVKQARGANVETLIQYRSSVLSATEDVEDALSALAQSESRRDEILREISSLQRARDPSQQSYEAGVIPLTDVLDANRQLLVAKDDLASTREAAARAAVSSLPALGGGWTPQ